MKKILLLVILKRKRKTFELLADGQTIEVEATLSTEEYPELVDFTEETQYKTLAKQLEKVSSSIIREIKKFNIQTILNRKNLFEDERWKSSHRKFEGYWG